MKKHSKRILIFGLALVVVITYISYLKFYKEKTYLFTAPKGQQYTLKYFKGAEIVDRSVIADITDNKELDDGKQYIVAYTKKDLGVVLTISDAIKKPFSKTCTSKSTFAFSVDEYEVCKFSSDGNTLLAKIGNDGKYFVATIYMVYDAKRITVSKDKTYAKQFRQFRVLDYQNELVDILRSIHPVN